jgi:hypothetical protein
MQWAMSGRLVSDTPQTVGRWFCVRQVDIPAQNGKMALYGRTVALCEKERDARAIVNTRAALKALLDWGREHTSPHDPNSPHDLLVAAAFALAEG